MDWLQETQWLLWIAAALAAVVLELLASGMVFGMVVGGAIAAAIAAFAGATFTVQVLVFAAVTAVLLVTLRPPMRRWADTRSPYVPTNADALVGREFEVLAEVTARDGRVKLAGDVWSARAAPGSEPLEPGSPAYVVRIDGATAVVASSRELTPGRDPA